MHFKTGSILFPIIGSCLNFQKSDGNGNPWIVYLKVCKGHFLKLFYDGQNERDYAPDFRKTGYNHLCVTIGDIRKTPQEIYDKEYTDSPEPDIKKSLTEQMAVQPRFTQAKSDSDKI